MATLGNTRVTVSYLIGYNTPLAAAEKPPLAGERREVVEAELRSMRYYAWCPLYDRSQTLSLPI